MASTDPWRWFSLGGEIASWVLVFALIGYWLSKQFHSPVFLVSACLAGVAMALYRMIRILSRP